MHKPTVIIIAALAESNRVIAKNGELPWNIPEDSQRFEVLTRNHTVVVGRKTWEQNLNFALYKQLPILPFDSASGKTLDNLTLEK